MKHSIKKIEPTTTKIGWIGTGVMGRWMCQHLMDLGYDMTVYNRTKSKAQPLLDAGATWVDFPERSCRRFGCYLHDCRVSTGCAGSLSRGYRYLKGATAGRYPRRYDDNGAVSRDRDLYRSAVPTGQLSVDAPVSGGDVGAREARLSIMVGGDEVAVQAVMPLLSAMGKNIVHQGEAGAGQHTKMCNQITISGTMIGVCEALLYGHKAGLDLETMLSSISGGAAACWSLDNLAPRVLKRNFDPGFFVEHFIKDMRIALDEARKMNLSLPGLP